ncbi:hypothetical protein ACIRL0_06535 [Streptomyces sp. NPDC102365]|uniref:hypothetical protein n=1 Tax=Streptomyces sp. NPDC102365 TaxID=3366162 RepID=UPI0038081CF8
MVAKKTTEEPAEEKTDLRHPNLQSGMSDADVVDARTVGGSPDGRFHKVFVIMSRDWRPDDADGMHEANKVAVLDDALAVGLNPRGDVRFDGAKEREARRSVELHYSVDVIPAFRDDAPHQTTTPSKAIDDLGGSTQVEK